jgi:hypothetical protein
MRNKAKKQALMIARIEEHYRAHGRRQYPTMSNYSIDEIIRVMRLFQLPTDDILAS